MQNIQNNIFIEILLNNAWGVVKQSRLTWQRLSSQIITTNNLFMNWLKMLSFKQRQTNKFSFHTPPPKVYLYVIKQKISFLNKSRPTKATLINNWQIAFCIKNKGRPNKKNKFCLRKIYFHILLSPVNLFNIRQRNVVYKTNKPNKKRKFCLRKICFYA